MLAINFSPSPYGRGGRGVRGIMPSVISEYRRRGLLPNVAKVLMITILLLPLLTFPQGKRANIWYFGYQAGIDFNQGSPPTALLDSEMIPFLGEGTGCATISDTLGRLQFYTDGVHIWNKTHQYMQNSGMIGTNSFQGAIIVPQPDHPDIYYLFNTERITEGYYPSFFQYSIIDMTLDNGNGAILPDYRCIPLSDTILPMFSAVMHENKKDIWVLSHRQNSNKYYAYLITSDGMSETPIESTAGPLMGSWGGLMKISPDGTKIGITVNDDSYTYSSFFEILEFNNSTGIVSDSNLIHKISGYSSCYLGLEFSPDNSVFYAYCCDGFVYQYDLDAGNEAQILATEYGINDFNNIGSLQLAPDGKIYISSNLKAYLSAIDKPNIVGAGCEFDLFAVNLMGRHNNARLPTFIQSYLNDPKFSTTSHCSGQTTQFTIENTIGIDSVKWKFGDWGNYPNDTSTLFNPQYTFSAPGIYYPILTVWSGVQSRFVRDTVIIYATPTPNLGADTLFCPGEAISLPLDAGPGEQYRWNDGFPGNDSLFIVSDTGTYWVLVNNHGCMGWDTIKVSWFDAQEFALISSEDDHCGQNKGKLTIFPQIGNPSDYTYSINGVDYFANGGLFSGLPAGPYTITIKSQSGCISAPVNDTIEDIGGPDITCVPTHATGLNDNGSISVITIDNNLTFQLEGYPPQQDSVFSNLTANTYYVIVTDEYGCITRDTVVIESNQGTLLLALADTARECLHQQANSDLKLVRAKGLRDMKAVLYYNSLMLNCTNFNANEADFPGITAMIYPSPSRVELSWNGINALPSADTLLLGSMIFESYDYGISNIEWEDNSAVTWFLDAAGDSIKAVLLPGEIEIHELPVANINAPLSVCEGESAILSALVSGGADPFELQWTTPSGSSFSDTIHLDTATLTDSGKYTLTVSDRFNCTDKSEVIFNVIPLPTAGFQGIGDTIPFEQTYLLEATQGYSSYEWSTGDTTYYINVTEQGEYTVTMMTDEGCKAAEHVYMLETFIPIRIPNAFTPNNDGLNDVFRPVIDYEKVRRFNLSIYNRWGQRIFETMDASAGWDGKNAMKGTYVWVITYENMVGKMFEMRGNVALVK